jgi:hypothetical protein
MEGLARIVNDSLERNGFDAPIDHQRLQWSKWFRCESSFSLLLLPSKPGLFALGEEMIAPGELPATGGKRMLAVFEVGEARDLGLAIGRLFHPGHLERERFASGKVFVRYAVMEDASQRSAACEAFQHWLASSTEAATGMGNEYIVKSASFAGNACQPAEPAEVQTQIDPPSSLPSGF